MMKHHALAIFAALACAFAARSEWTPEAVDISAGAAAPAATVATAGLLPPADANFTIGALPPEVRPISLSAADTNLVTLFVAVTPTLVRTVYAGRVSPASTNAALWAYAVTSSVEVALGVLTNGAAALSPGFWLDAGDSLAVKSTNSAVAVGSATIQQTRPAWSATSPASFLSVLPGTFLPTSAVVTVSAVTSGVTVAELAAFTGTPSAWTDGVTIAPGDSISVTVAGATNSFPVTVTRQPAVAFSNLYASATYLRSASAASFLPASAVVTVSAVTSGVAVAELATFTGDAPDAWDDGLWLAAGDSISVNVAGATNTAAVTLTTQAISDGLAVPAPGLALRLWSARLTAAPAPTNAAVTLTYNPYLGDPAIIATLTDTVLTNTTALYLYPGDTISVAAPGATNTVTVRLHTDRFQP